MSAPNGRHTIVYNAEVYNPMLSAYEDLVALERVLCELEALWAARECGVDAAAAALMRTPKSVAVLFNRSGKRRVRQFYRWLMKLRSRRLGDEQLKHSAIVFAPHFDDETLGCGGTVLRKRELGAKVKVVFMTDGSHSHRHLMAAERLREIRAQEAVAAVRTLGLDPAAALLLGFEETRLSEHVPAVTSRVAEILAREEPEEIFVPYWCDPHSDHMACNRAVLSAARSQRRRVTVYEYPIWVWNHWPWASRPTQSGQTIMRSVTRSVIWDRRLLRDLRWSVHIGAMLERKRAALGHYRSQMTRLMPDPAWWTLGDHAEGEFVECFFQEHEVFHRYSLPSAL